MRRPFVLRMAFFFRGQSFKFTVDRRKTGFKGNLMIFTMSFTSRLTLVAACVALWGCAAGAGGSGTETYKDITWRAGEGSMFIVNEKTLRILNRYNYETVRREDSQQLVFYQTSWKYRNPFDDELEKGVIDARTRLTVKARPRRTAAMAGASNMYAVQVVAENMVQMADTGEWTRMPNSEAYKAYIRDIAKALENELRMSINIF